MATPIFETMTEFCEQTNPRVLLEMRRTRPFPEMLPRPGKLGRCRRKARIALAGRPHSRSHRPRPPHRHSALPPRSALESSTPSRLGTATPCSASSPASPSTGSEIRSTAPSPAFANASVRVTAFTSTTWSTASAPSR